MPGRLLAHALAENLPAAGEVEPLVGREWLSDAPRYRHAGNTLHSMESALSRGVQSIASLISRLVRLGCGRGLSDAHKTVCTR